MIELLAALAAAKKEANIVLLKGHGYHLAWTYTPGRLAGERAAQENILPKVCERNEKHS